MQNVMHGAVERGLRIVLNNRVDEILRVAVKSDWPSWRRCCAGVSLYKSKNQKAAAAVRQSEQSFGEDGLMLVALNEIEPTLDLNVQCFSRIKRQVGEPTTVWRRQCDAHDGPLSHPTLLEAVAAAGSHFDAFESRTRPGLLPFEGASGTVRINRANQPCRPPVFGDAPSECGPDGMAPDLRNDAEG